MVDISAADDNSHLTAEKFANNQAIASNKGASQTKLTSELRLSARCMIPLDIQVGDILAQQNW